MRLGSNNRSLARLVTGHFPRSQWCHQLTGARQLTVSIQPPGAITASSQLSRTSTLNSSKDDSSSKDYSKRFITSNDGSRSLSSSKNNAEKFNDSEADSDYEDPDQNEQRKKANLGSIIEDLKELVPNIVNKSISKDLISSEVLLRICPTHFAEFNAYLPNIKGHVSYYTTCKTLQLILTSIVVNPKVKLHIQSVRTSKGTGSFNDDKPDYRCVFPDSTKIFLRWSTCAEGCFHLSTGDTDRKDDFHSTSDAKLGSHSWSKLDASKFFNSTDSVPPSLEEGSKTLPSIKTTIAEVTTSLIGLTKEERKLERVISGLFIFELNEDNSKIIVHTVEDVDVVERTEFENLDDKLRVC